MNRDKRKILKMTNFGVLFYPETKSQNVWDLKRNKDVSDILDDVYLTLGTIPTVENVFYYNELKEESNIIRAELGDILNRNNNYLIEFLFLADEVNTVSPIALFIGDKSFIDNENISYIELTEFTYDNGNSVSSNKVNRSNQGVFNLAPTPMGGSNYSLYSRIKIVKLSSNKIYFETKFSAYSKASSNGVDMIQSYEQHGLKKATFNITEDLLFELSGATVFPVGTKLIGYKNINDVER